jgi:SAM-dependent methyltransferase
MDEHGEIHLSGFLPQTLTISDPTGHRFIWWTAMMPEGDRLWTLGQNSLLAFAVPAVPDHDVFVRFDLVPFTWGEVLPDQNVEIRLGETSLASWSISGSGGTRRAVVIPCGLIPPSNIVCLNFVTPGCTRPCDLGINGDVRELGIAITRISWELAADRAAADRRAREYGRRVGTEARKSFDDKLDSGFWRRFITGPNVLDIGFRGYESNVVPIADGAIGVDMDFPGYDGTTLPFVDESQDAVYSSHCLEHIGNHLQVIRDWFRVVKVGGHVITVVPNMFLYERRRRPPSRFAGWNHLRFYSSASLLAEFESALVPNTYRVRHLAENDAAFRYDLPTDVHPDGCYEIELVIQKINPPAWKLEE